MYLVDDYDDELLNFHSAVINVLPQGPCNRLEVGYIHHIAAALAPYRGLTDTTTH